LLEEFNSQSRENLYPSIDCLALPLARSTHLFAAFNGNAMHYASDFSSPFPLSNTRTRVKYGRGRGMQSSVTRLPAEILPNHQVVRRAAAPGTAQFARVLVVVSLIVSRLITAFICVRSPAHRPSIRPFSRAGLPLHFAEDRQSFITFCAQGLHYTKPTDNDIEYTMNRHQLSVQVAKCVSLSFSLFPLSVSLSISLSLCDRLR